MATPLHWVVQYCSSVKPYTGPFTWEYCVSWITIGKFPTKEEADSFKEGESKRRRESPVGTALRVYPIYPSVTLNEGSSDPTVFVEVRFLKDVPSIVGVNMKTYGPFIKGRVYAIPKENARILLKQGLVVATRKEAKKPTLKEMFKGEVLTPYIEAALVRPLVEEEARGRVGYRVGEPEETNAKKVIEFEVVELENEHILVDVGKALNVTPTLAAIKEAIDKRFGPDAEAIWLCDTSEHAVKRYGPGEVYSVEIPPDAIVVSDLGPDGKLWIWRTQAEEESIVRATEKVEKILKEIREARGE